MSPTPDPGGVPQRPGRMPSRREFLALGAGAFLVAAVPLVGRRSLRLVRRSAPSMGTVAEMAAAHRDPRYAHAALDAALAELRRVEAAMTRFRDDSDVGRVNFGAGKEAVSVSEETAHVVREALRWAEATEGDFDPTLGRAVALWDVGRRTEPPAPEEVRALAGLRGYLAVEVGRRRGEAVIRLHHPDAALDLGGIAKGYGVDRAAAVLRDWGIGGGLVNVGGDLYALGSGPGGDPWRVGVRDPGEPGRIREVLSVSDAAVATSGDYEAYFEHGGVRYHHLLDPATAAPHRTRAWSVTVLAADCLTADAAATAVFGLEPHRGRARIADVAPGARIV